jgi:serine/threonine-protein kinase
MQRRAGRPTIDRELAMKLKTPLVTLAVGLVVAGILFALNVSINRDVGDDAAPDLAAASTTPSESATATPTPTPTVGDGSGPAGQGETITYAGWVDGEVATLAIVVNNGKALAYVCDGVAVEAWLEGTMSDGLINLTGAAGSLTGTYANGEVTGDVTAGQKAWHFTLPTVAPPSGAYRSAEGLRGQLDASWVVLPDGEQVGVDRTGGTPRPAAPFDLSSGTAVVGGTSVPIEPAQPR